MTFLDFRKLQAHSEFNSTSFEAKTRRRTALRVWAMAVWAMADLPSTVDGKSICENLRILSGVTSILQLAKVKLSSE